MTFILPKWLKASSCQRGKKSWFMYSLSFWKYIHVYSNRPSTWLLIHALMQVVHNMQIILSLRLWNLPHASTRHVCSHLSSCHKLWNAKQHVTSKDLIGYTFRTHDADMIRGYLMRAPTKQLHTDSIAEVPNRTIWDTGWNMEQTQALREWRK